MQAFGQESWKDYKVVSWRFVMFWPPGISSTFPCLGKSHCVALADQCSPPPASPLSVAACGTGSQLGQLRDPSPKRLLIRQLLLRMLFARPCGLSSLDPSSFLHRLSGFLSLW